MVAPLPLLLRQPFPLPLSEGELKGVPAQRDAGGSYTHPATPAQSSIHREAPLPLDVQGRLKGFRAS